MLLLLLLFRVVFLPLWFRLHCDGWNASTITGDEVVLRKSVARTTKQQIAVAVITLMKKLLDEFMILSVKLTLLLSQSGLYPWFRPTSLVY